jgi:hypothetical protein
MTIIDHLFRVRNYGLQDIFDHEALIKTIHLLKDNQAARELISYGGSSRYTGTTECRHENGWYHTIEFEKWWMKFSKRFFCCSDCGELIEVKGRKY